ncbi:hypothetical protein GCM10009567_12320 [Rothia amarae]
MLFRISFAESWLKPAIPRMNKKIAIAIATHLQLLVQFRVLRVIKVATNTKEIPIHIPIGDLVAWDSE